MIDIKKILIIEDEISYQTLLQDQLSHKGYSVITAKDGIEGLAMAKAQHPDLIILDIRMPGMDGITMLDELRKDEYGKSAKVIFLSNLEPDDTIIQKVIEHKPSFYMIKSDVQIADLLIKIEEVLDDKQNG